MFGWCFIALPSIPIIAAWVQIFRLSKSTMPVVKPLIPLSLTTISYGWVLVGIFLAAVIGPDYSSRRFITIGINFVVMTVLALYALILEKRLKWVEFVACALTASVWLYAAVVSSVVWGQWNARQINIWQTNRRLTSRWIQKYREVTKRWHRGTNINIVAQQKKVSRWNRKYREVTKDKNRGEHGNIVIVRTLFTPILKAARNKVSWKKETIK